MKLAARLQLLADALPPDGAVMLTRRDLLQLLAEEPAAESDLAPALQPETWRERLWSCPPETRLGVRELAEAVDRSPDWVYRAVDKRRSEQRGRDPLPCSRLDGVLVFRAGAIRDWLERSERLVVPERRLRVMRGGG